MTDTVRDALASHSREFSVKRRLHAVPPHMVHEVRFGGKRAVCKVATGPTAEPETEGRVLEFVAEHSTVPVPRVLAVGTDHFVAEWVDDLPEDPTVDAARVRAMGRGMATLHDGLEGRFGRTGLLRTAGTELAVDPAGRWSDTLAAFLEECRRYLSAVGYGDVAREVREFVTDHRRVYDAVDGATLLHGNYLPDHVGIDREEDGATVVRVVDFEHALVGPPEWDYLRTAVPLFGLDGEDPLASSFRAGYESVRPLPEGVDRRRRAHAVVIATSYLRALHVQRTHLDADVGGAEPADPLALRAVARRARRLRRRVTDLLGDLRAELG